jgi:hypothetical protein
MGQARQQSGGLTAPAGGDELAIVIEYFDAVVASGAGSRLAPDDERAHLRDRVQKCVKPRKSKVSGFPSPSLSSWLSGSKSASSKMDAERVAHVALRKVRPIRSGYCVPIPCEKLDFSDCSRLPMAPSLPAPGDYGTSCWAVIQRS